MQHTDPLGLALRCEPRDHAVCKRFRHHFWTIRIGHGLKPEWLQPSKMPLTLSLAESIQNT